MKKVTKNQNIAVLYARYSSDNQRAEPIDAQLRAMHKYCQVNGIKVLREYCDYAKSGTSDKRPEFMQMIHDSVNGEFDTVIVHKLDRFSRNKFDSVVYTDKLNAVGIKLRSVCEKIEDTPESKLMVGIKQSIDQYYSDNLAREVMKGMNENALKCLWTGGIPPLGYDVVDKKLVINEEEAKAVRLIFEMSADGNGYNTIIRKLNALGYKTKKGADFGKNSLYEILRNERYYGKFIFNKRSSAQFRRKRNNHAYKDESEMIVVEDGNPAIVSKSLWEKANQVRKAVNNKSVSANRVYLLTGLIRCGNCDSKLHGNVKRHKGKDKVYYSYRCSSRSSKLDCNCKEIRCEIIDTWVINEFIKYFFNEESIAYITKKLNESLVDTIKNSRDYTDAKSNMKTLLNNRKNLAEAIEKTDDSDYLLSKFKEVENRIKNAKEIIEQYENRIEIERVDEKTVRELIEQLRDYMYNPKNVAQTKYILSKYIEKVVVNNDEATVIFKVLAPVTTTGAIPYEPFECGYEETFTVNRKELFLIYKILETDEELNLIIRRLTTKNDKNTENSHRNIEKLQNQITENHIKTYPTQQNVG